LQNIAWGIACGPFLHQRNQGGATPKPDPNRADRRNGFPRPRRVECNETGQSLVRGTKQSFWTRMQGDAAMPPGYEGEAPQGGGHVPYRQFLSPLGGGCLPGTSLRKVNEIKKHQREQHQPCSRKNSKKEKKGPTRKKYKPKKPNRRHTRERRKGREDLPQPGPGDGFHNTAKSKSREIIGDVPAPIWAEGKSINTYGSRQRYSGATLAPRRSKANSHKKRQAPNRKKKRTGT